LTRKTIGKTAFQIYPQDKSTKENAMSHHGLPCWYELASNDTATAQDFYTATLGWTWTDSGTPGMTYLLAKVADAMVAGLYTADPGSPIAWSFYTAVDSADATADLAKSLGATVIVPPTDIPNTGRFAVMIDPQGAAFAILQPLPGGTGGAYDQKKNGHGNWHDLSSPDTAKALAFYAPLFGWTESRTMQMGPSLTYTVLAAQGQDIGGIFTEAGSSGPAKWCIYFGTASITKATTAIKAKGGKVLHDPAPVPGGAFITHCTDPSGAEFALVGQM
jgi:uncharacterized protein